MENSKPRRNLVVDTARLADLRARHGMSQRDLAEAAAVSPGLIGQIETGTRSPSLRTAHAIAKALGVELSEFCRTTDEGGLVNEFEAHNRALKAMAIADLLTAQGVQADVAEAMNPKGRAAAAELAKQRPPSDRTWQLVVDLLRQRETVSDDEVWDDLRRAGAVQ